MAERSRILPPPRSSIMGTNVFASWNGASTLMAMVRWKSSRLVSQGSSSSPYTPAELSTISGAPSSRRMRNISRMEDSLARSHPRVIIWAPRISHSVAVPSKLESLVASKMRVRPGAAKPIASSLPTPREAPVIRIRRAGSKPARSTLAAAASPDSSRSSSCCAITPSTPRRSPCASGVRPGGVPGQFPQRSGCDRCGNAARTPVTSCLPVRDRP